MDHAVALVEAYLQISGYFTVAEYPVIEALGKRQFGVATDLDILAVRFPGAGRLVPGRGGREMFVPDPELGIDADKPDMLIGEVKEGRAELNRNARDPKVLRTALARFGCCSVHDVDTTIQALISKGVATTHGGHRVRMVAFGSSVDESVGNGYSVVSLGHIARFITGYLNEHWDVLRHGQFKHPTLGMFMLMEKTRRKDESKPE